MDSHNALYGQKTGEISRLLLHVMRGNFLRFINFAFTMNGSFEDLNLLRQVRSHHPLSQSMVAVGREISDGIDLEIGPGDDDSSFSHVANVMVGGSSQDQCNNSDDQKYTLMSLHGQLDMEPPRKKKRVVKKWREEWAETYNWAFVALHEGSYRIFCSICNDFGRKHRRNPYGNEGSRNMQMSALEEHNNSLLHKEALRLQIASKDKNISALERPLYIKGNHCFLINSLFFEFSRQVLIYLDFFIQCEALLSKSAESIVEAVMRRDPHEVEYVQAVQEIVRSLEPVLAKHPQ